MDGWYAGNARSNFLSNLNFYNAEAVRLSSCPMGAQAGSQRCVATFTKGITISFKLRLALTSCLNSETCILNDYGNMLIGYRLITIVIRISESLFLIQVFSESNHNSQYFVLLIFSFTVWFIVNNISPIKHWIETWIQQKVFWHSI